jgi:serine/threonine-protein phosphatase 6 regulatory ankyrin repeat subunit B
MKYLRLFESFEEYDPYELMLIPPQKKGEMIIHELDEDEPNLNFIKDLITMGADMEVQDEEGETILHRCVAHNLIDIIDTLINAGIDLNVRDAEGYTALYKAITSNKEDISKTLIQAGADVNISDNMHSGWSALHSAAWNYNPLFIEMLIGAGADVNMQDEVGCTPLHELAKRSRFDDIEDWGLEDMLLAANMIIDAGANLTIEDNKGKLPYDYAKFAELKNILKP